MDGEKWIEDGWREMDRGWIERNGSRIDGEKWIENEFNYNKIIIFLLLKKIKLFYFIHIIKFIVYIIRFHP